MICTNIVFTVNDIVFVYFLIIRFLSIIMVSQPQNVDNDIITDESKSNSDNSNNNVSETKKILVFKLTYYFLCIKQRPSQ